MASLYMLHMAIVRSNSTSPADILAEIQGEYDASFYGLISQDRYGQNSQKELTTLQYFGDGSVYTCACRYLLITDVMSCCDDVMMSW